jgi:hypothetical protein
VDEAIDEVVERLIAELKEGPHVPE